MFGMTKCVVRSWTVAVAAAATMSLAGAAHAYDRHDCDVMFGSANVTSVDTFSIEGGAADFGDDLHVLGTPLGTAVVCWAIDGRAAVKGKLYADDFREPVRATVEIRFQRKTGQVSGLTKRSVQGQGTFLASREVEKVSSFHNFDRVRIRLFTFKATDLGPASRLVATKTLHR